MSDYLLKGLHEIHREIFKDKAGKPVLCFQTFYHTHVANMKRCGVIFKWHLGRVQRPTFCGWRNPIMNYLMLEGRKREEVKKLEVEK